MNWNSFKRVMGYAIVTAAVSVIGQLDSMNFEFSKLDVNACIGMLLKAMLPGLISIKALYDDTLTDTKSQHQSNE